MCCVLHEIVHAYQTKCCQVSYNDNEKLIANNYQNMMEFIRNFMGNSTESNIAIHDSFVSEIEADNNAMLYMIYISEMHPEYFDRELLDKKIIDYKERLEIEFFCHPYKSFDELLTYLENLLEYRNLLGEQEKIEIEKLKVQNNDCEISDSKLNGIYYNIFLNNYYFFENNRLIIDEKQIKK